MTSRAIRRRDTVLEMEEELAAVAETGLYGSREDFLADAVETLLAARPDLREAVACQLYQRGTFSLERAAVWAGVSIEEMKETLHRQGISRESSESLEEIESAARRSAGAMWSH
jgi:predicted HTH domain antitoxin